MKDAHYYYRLSLIGTVIGAATVMYNLLNGAIAAAIFMTAITTVGGLLARFYSLQMKKEN